MIEHHDNWTDVGGGLIVWGAVILIAAFASRKETGHPLNAPSLDAPSLDAPRPVRDKPASGTEAPEGAHRSIAPSRASL